MDIAEFEERYFDELNNAIWKVIRDYCYIYGFQINHNFGLDRSRITIMLQAITIE